MKMHNPEELQSILITAAKNGNVEQMIELIGQGADALAICEDGTKILSYLAQSNVNKADMRKFVAFINPYIYQANKNNN